MTEQEIELCLERFATCKTTDVMNFDYAGTLAYLNRLKSENAELRARLDKAVELPSIRKHFTRDGVVYELVYKDDLGFVHTKWCDRDDFAEAHLAELKGGK